MASGSQKSFLFPSLFHYHSIRVASLLVSRVVRNLYIKDNFSFFKMFIFCITFVLKNRPISTSTRRLSIWESLSATALGLLLKSLQFCKGFFTENSLATKSSSCNFLALGSSYWGTSSERSWAKNLKNLENLKFKSYEYESYLSNRKTDELPAITMPIRAFCAIYSKTSTGHCSARWTRVESELNSRSLIETLLKWSASLVASWN